MTDDDAVRPRDLISVTYDAAGPERTRLTVCGELDGASASAFSKILDDVVEAGSKHLELDMNGVSFIDSAGLSALIRGYKAAERRGGSLVILERSYPVTRLLSVTGQLERFTVTQTPRTD